MLFKTIKLIDPLEDIKKVNLMWIKYKDISVPLRLLDKVIAGGTDGYLLANFYKNGEYHTMILREDGRVFDSVDRDVHLNYGEFNHMIATNRDKEVLLAKAMKLQEEAKDIMAKLNK